MTVSLVALWSLWRRRHTFRYRWETYSTVCVACFLVSAILRIPVISRVTDLLFHAVTGLWSLSAYFCLASALASLCAMICNAVAKLCSDEEFPRWFRTRIEWPTAFAAAGMFALLARSTAVKEPHPDFFTMKVSDPALSAFWVLFVEIVLYLLYQGIEAFIDLRSDEYTRCMVHIYLVASVCMAIAAGTRLITVCIHSLQTPVMMNLIATTAWISVCLFCWAAGYSWTRRLRWFG